MALGAKSGEGFSRTTSACHKASSQAMSRHFLLTPVTRVSEVPSRRLITSRYMSSFTAFGIGMEIKT
jgi:hypothetical protein